VSEEKFPLTTQAGLTMVQQIQLDGLRYEMGKERQESYPLTQRQQEVMEELEKKAELVNTPEFKAELDAMQGIGKIA
jgi:hypothetical protein